MGHSIVGILRRLAALPDNAGERSPYLILTVVCLAMILDLINLSAVTIALPTIQRQFGTEQSQLQWVISAYALTFGSFLLLGGRAGDLFGHRRVLLFGLCFFTLFTLVCALSPDFVGLVIGRAFQGIGAGFTIPSAQAHIAVYFPDPKKKAKALGWWSAAGSTGFVVGLILGGVLTAQLSWRWIFWISMMLSCLVIPATYLTLPRRKLSTTVPVIPVAETAEDNASAETAVERRAARAVSISASIKERLVRFDVLGVFLGVPGLLLLTFALTSANSSGWGSASIVSTLVVAAVLLALFAFHEVKTSSAPLLNPRLFHNLSFNLTLVLAVMTYSVRQACTYFLTLQLQSYGNSPLHTALLFLPMGVSAFVSNMIACRLAPVLGARFVFVLGWALTIPGVILFSFVSDEADHGFGQYYWRFAFPGLVLYIAGLSFIYVTANFVVTSSAQGSDQGVVAGIFNVALQVGGSVMGLAVLTAVADGVNERYAGGELSSVGYKSVYYSSAILCGIALILSLTAIRVPEAMRGSVWTKRGNKASEEKEKEEVGGEQSNTSFKVLANVTSEATGEKRPVTSTTKR